jgi:tetratricopeptide (TPR) repeat protein
MRAIPRSRDAAAAAAAAREALQIYVRVGATRESIGCLNAIGAAAVYRGDLAEARSAFERAAELARTLDDPHYLGAAVGNFGNVAMYERDFAAAQPFLEEAVEITRRLGANEMLAGALVNAAVSASQLGAIDRAAAFLREGLDLQSLVHDVGGTVAALVATEQILLARQEWQSSVLAGAGASALARSTGFELEPLEHELHTGAVEVAESKLGRAELEAAAAAGRELGREELIRFALEALA